jgi:hypothetical protein
MAETMNERVRRAKVEAVLARAIADKIGRETIETRRERLEAIATRILRRGKAVATRAKTTKRKRPKRKKRGEP